MPSRPNRNSNRKPNSDRKKPSDKGFDKKTERKSGARHTKSTDDSPRFERKPKRTDRNFERDFERKSSRTSGKNFDKEKSDRKNKNFRIQEERTDSKRSDRKNYRDDKFSQSRPKSNFRKGRDEDSNSKYGRKKYEKSNYKDFGRGAEKRWSKKPQNNKVKDDGLIRLNRYIANSGVCSRRDADNLILAGVVKVNGKVVDELGAKVKPTDRVEYGGQRLNKEKMIYILLNKPKGYITTVEDPFSRKTVLELITGACKQRVYPVGRLDRNTSGVLLLTNDGELTRKMTHPSFGAKKIYHVTLDKNVKVDDMQKLVDGLELEDGKATADKATYVQDVKSEVGVEMHMGKNRVVRRMFEHLGYQVIKLDRVYFGGLTKKNVQRGKWRILTEKEVNFLKMNRE